MLVADATISVQAGSPLYFDLDALVTGGTRPLDYMTLVPGVGPGLEVHLAGGETPHRIVGTPTTAGTTIFDLTVHDHDGVAAHATLTLVVSSSGSGLGDMWGPNRSLTGGLRTAATTFKKAGV